MQVFRISVLMLAVVLFSAGCPSAGKKTLSGTWLSDADFETRTSKLPPDSWSVKNEGLARLRIEERRDGDRGNALFVELQGRSEGVDNTYLLVQTLDLAALRGQNVRYGGQVRTRGTRVYLRLWSPEGNSEIEVEDADEFRNVARTFLVPDNASVLAFAVEVVGDRGAGAWVDNLFVGESAAPAGQVPRPETSTITIDASKKIGRINPLIYSGHMEWIYSGHGIWDEKKRTLDQHILDELKPLHIPLWRFPGGIYSDYYNWRDGIGDAGKRADDIDPIDQRTKLRHDFGTDEFIEFLRSTDAEALITANYGTGSKDLAVSWLEYFKQKGVKVRYWEIGNEVYQADPKDPRLPNGARIYHTAKEYASDFVRWADALKSVDAGIQVGAIGGIANAHPSNRDWMDTLLKQAGHKIDFLALHNAFAPIIMTKFDYMSKDNRLKAYTGMFAQVEDFKKDIKAVKQKLAKHVPDRADDIPLAITEHFPIFGADLDESNRKQYVEGIDQSRTLAAALYTASILTVIANDPHIFMACFLNPVHMYYGSLINTSSEGLTRNFVYYVFDMYRNVFGEEAIYSKFEGATFSSSAVGIVPRTGNIPVLEVAAARRSDRTITVAVVNKDLANEQTAAIELLGAGPATVCWAHTLSAPWPNAVTAKPLSESTRRLKSLEIARRKVEITGAVSFPPCSFTMLVFEAQDSGANAESP